VNIDVFGVLRNNGMVGKVNGRGIVTLQGNRYLDIEFLHSNEIPAGLSSSCR